MFVRSRAYLDSPVYAHKDSRYFSKAFGLRVQRAREDAGLSKAALAREVGVLTREISQMESGTRRVRLNTALAVAQVLELDLRDRT